MRQTDTPILPPPVTPSLWIPPGLKVVCGLMSDILLLAGVEAREHEDGPEVIIPVHCGEPMTIRSLVGPYSVECKQCGLELRDVTGPMFDGRCARFATRDWVYDVGPRCWCYFPGDPKDQGGEPRDSPPGCRPMEAQSTSGEKENSSGTRASQREDREATSALRSAAPPRDDENPAPSTDRPE